MLKNLIFTGFCLIFLSGCIFTKEPYRNVRYFDIGIPESAKDLKGKIKIHSFTMSGSARNSMSYRVSANELYEDDYNKWIQPPERMLTNYLKVYFSGQTAEDAPKYEISGKIIAFEFDLTKNETVLVADWAIIRESDKESCEVNGCRRFSISMKDKSPASFASAMSSAVAALAEELKKNLN